MNLASHEYSGAEDLQLMLNLLVAARPVDRFTDYPSPVDLHEVLALPQVQANTRLWIDARGRIVAFALVDHYSNLCFEIAPRIAHPAIETEIIAWGAACIRRAMRAEELPAMLDASCRDDDVEHVAMLERHGFVLQDGRALHFSRSLLEPIQAPVLPDGFTIRHVAGEHEVEALVVLHRAAFGTENMTVEERLAMMRVPEYDPTLDLLAVSPDGQFAAYCMCSISQEENARTGRNEGYTDPLATHPAFQRRGLARALLLTGLHLLKERGVDTAALGTSSENVAMQRLALAVGFYVQSRTLWFSKPVVRAQ